MSIPNTPKEFFCEYVPERFSELAPDFSAVSSNGSMVFRLLGGEEFSYRLTDGRLELEAGMQEDVILQVSLSPEDFNPVLVRSAEAQEGRKISAEHRIMAFKALTADAQKTSLVRGIRGTVAFVVQDGGATHRIYVTPGPSEPNTESPDCRLECSMTDFLEMQMGSSNPMQLAMSGKIRIVGNAQIPMALSSVFV